MAEFTTLEIAAMCKRTERSVQRWLKEGKLPAQHIQGNRYEVNESDLARFLPHEVADDLVERMTALESRLERIESIILSLGSAETKQPRKRATIAPVAIETPEDIPVGSVSYSEFAAHHGVNRRTFLDHLREGKVPQIERKKAHRNEVEHWLSPEQQQAAIEYWESRGTPFETRPDLYPHLDYGTR